MATIESRRGRNGSATHRARVRVFLAPLAHQDVQPRNRREGLGQAHRKPISSARTKKARTGRALFRYAASMTRS
jgi:hypothetical protein